MCSNPLPPRAATPCTLMPALCVPALWLQDDTLNSTRLLEESEADEQVWDNNMF